MLILLAALARVEGNADFAAQVLAAAHEVGRVPEGEGPRPGEPALHRRLRRPPGAQRQPLDQGDPGAGRLRACCASMTGRKQEAARVPQDRAGVRAASGCELADDGDHYRLAFDKPGTWSQKYNLVWDKLLGLESVPARGGAQGDRVLPDEAERATACRSTIASDYTKLDWIVWTATLAENQADFEALVAPAYQFANESPTPRPADRLVRHRDRQAAGLPGALGGRRAVHQDAGRPGDVEEVRCTVSIGRTRRLRYSNGAGKDQGRRGRAARRPGWRARARWIPSRHREPARAGSVPQT